LPSGNRCHANFVHDQALGITHLFFVWDVPPPMQIEDAGYYFNVVVPGIAKLLTSRTPDIAVSAAA